MAAFSRLRDRIGNKPELLEEEAVKDAHLAKLCDDTFLAAAPLHEKEGSRRELYTAPTNPDFQRQWRDYQFRYSRSVGSIVFWIVFNEPPSRSAESEEMARDTYFAAVAADAASDASSVQNTLDYAKMEIEFYRDQGVYPEEYVSEVENGIATWNNLVTEIGFDLTGVLRRRRLTPFVLIPRHVSNHYGGSDALSLMARLQQAQEAFVYGIPLGALAIMRSILEIILRKHYQLGNGKLVELIENAAANGRFPIQIRLSEIQRLLKLGNDAVHPNPEALHKVFNIEMEVLSLLLTIRTLIEHVPKSVKH